MATHRCSKCGARHVLPAQERVYRCRECGSRETVPVQADPGAAGVPADGGPAPVEAAALPAAEPTILLAGDDAAPSVSVACPGCGSFAPHARLCGICGSPLPVIDPAPAAKRVPAAPEPAPAGAPRPGPPR